jgi:asparagine synthase (glutamine-hydrolysing)
MWPLTHSLPWRRADLARGRSNPGLKGPPLGWNVAYGAGLDRLPATWTWRQGPIALWCDNGPKAERPWVQGYRNPQLYLFGGVWLSDRRSCLAQLADRPMPEGQSPSDRQLVAWLWEQQGPAALEALVGNFAFGIWDGQTEQFWLVRDRTGAETLYYGLDQEVQWVAPRLSGLKAHRSNRVDAIALRDYLCCGFVPGERTMWESVREVRPGQILELSRQSSRYYGGWSVEAIVAPGTLTEQAQELRGLLEQVVAESLPDAQPVGVFLSGGLDSSAVTALARQLHPEPIHTFSIHFGNDLPNELEFSSLVAQHCQTQHHILEIPLKTLWDRLPETIALLDDPIGDPLTVPNLMVGQLAREFVTVILNGEGGDPCFGGPKNQPMLLQQLYQADSGAISTAYLNSFQKCSMDLPNLLKPDLWQAVKEAPSVFAEDLQSSGDYLNRLMLLNIKFKGADQILTKVQNLTQAANLVGRSPLFDARVVDFSLNIPPQYKLAGAEEKAILKRAVADILPEAIIRRPKSGMMVPVQFGFRQVWNQQARRLLLSRDAAIRPYLNQDLIRQWLDYQGDPWSRYGVKLWLIATLEYWLQIHQN